MRVIMFEGNIKKKDAKGLKSKFNVNKILLKNNNAYK